jgi:hypothetical protein
MVKILPKIGKHPILVAICIAYFAFTTIGKYTTYLKNKISVTAVLGQQEIPVNSSEFAASARLPLVRVGAIGNTLGQSSIDDSLLYARKADEVVKVVSTVPLIEQIIVIDIDIDVMDDVNRYIKLISVLENGAIINGKFVSVGDYLNVRIRNKEGIHVSPKLVMVSPLLDGIVLNVSGQRLKVEF